MAIRRPTSFFLQKNEEKPLEGGAFIGALCAAKAAVATRKRQAVGVFPSTSPHN